jgi:hypothetical protein
VPLAAVDIGGEIAKSAVSFTFIAILGGLVGVAWEGFKRRREQSRASLELFFAAYGEWFATWKLWAAATDAGSIGTLGVDLLERATAVEGKFEALLVKVATERPLDADQMRRLGRFREAYQSLRESIEQRRSLDWNVRGRDDHVQPYVAFKVLSTEFARLLSPSALRRPSRDAAGQALVTITSWRPEEGAPSHWWDAAGSATAMERTSHAYRNLKL